MCDKAGCNKVARHRAVLLLRASKNEKVISHPLNFVLCDLHQLDFRSFLDLDETLDEELWPTIVAHLAPSGRIPDKKLTNLTWEPVV